MKKVIYGLVLSSMIVSSSVAGVKDVAKNTWGHVTNHKVAYSFLTVGALTVGLVSYDIVKNDAKVLTKMGLMSAQDYPKLKEVAKKHPIIAATFVVSIITSAGIGSEVYLRGDNSWSKKGFNWTKDKVKGLFSKKESSEEESSEEESSEEEVSEEEVSEEEVSDEEELPKKKSNSYNFRESTRKKGLKYKK